ncbi:hypothetical protein, partial [Glutamicibacter sp. AOP3-A1-12]|uniref:hypothetical protein n=1 Tax=Glutamicibacter sp. AOP3-A1-12 TaxID=3457701 RepID=UPI004033D8B2
MIEPHVDFHETLSCAKGLERQHAPPSRRAEGFNYPLRSNGKVAPLFFLTCQSPSKKLFNFTL